MKTLIILVAALVSCSAWASGEDLENCLWKDGREMDSRDCATFRRIADEDKEKEDAYQKMVVEMRAQQRINEDARQSEKAKQQAIIQEGNQKRIAEMARKDAENKRAREEWERKEAKEKATLKRKCGKDYMSIRIGMTIERLQECYWAHYVTKTVNKDGVVETYRTMFDWVNVQNGHVISYTKRTR